MRLRGTCVGSMGWMALATWTTAAGDVSVLDAAWEANAQAPVPVGAQVRLETDRTEYFLGENVLIDFVLENQSEESFEASFGGDYRGASRSLRFKVTATDSAGRPAVDPDPEPLCLGGIGGPQTLEPGQTFIQSLPLMRYCDITEPGAYTVRVTHDFGWKEGERRRPVGEKVLTFHRPNAQEAERILAAMESLTDLAGSTGGRRTAGYADYGCLRQPIYLKPLLRRALQGDRRALTGIGSISTPEATGALVELALDATSALAIEAALTLNARLPDPEFEGLLPGRGPFRNDAIESRRRRAAQAWDPALAPRVRHLATNLLSQPDTTATGAGAFMIQAVGTPVEAPIVLSAMGRVLDRRNEPRRSSEDNILNLPEPLPELLRAMRTLQHRGLRLGLGLSGSAQILVYFTWLEGTPPPRPASWLGRLQAFGRGGVYPVREAAVRSIPYPLPESCVALVAERLVDADLGVCRAACAVAEQSGDPRFRQPLLDLITTEHHVWLLRAASNAASTLGAGMDLLDTWAERLNEEELYGEALNWLQTVIADCPGASSGRTDLTRRERIELREAWRSFLTRHGEALRSGKRFRLGDPELTASLFGRARSWRLADGTYWPMHPSDQARPPSE